MSEHKENVPKLRFPGFTDAWEHRRLGELCDEFQSGKNIKSEDIRDEGRYPVFGGNGLRGRTNTYNHDGLYALIGRQGALCGNMNISYGKAYFTEHAIAVKGNKNNETRFLFYLLGEMNLGQYSGQSAQPGLAVNKLIALSAFIPSFAEQAQISAFFKKLDRLITLHQRKLNNLKNLKAGLLQKMFPKNGEDFPEVRFPGFTDAWEQRRLGDLADFFDEKRIPIDSGKRKIGEYPYYGATGIIDYVDGYIFEGEYVLLAEDGANITMRNSPIAYLTEGKFWLNNHAHIMRMKDGSNKFLLQLLEKQDYEKYNSGTAQPKLNGQVVKKLNLSFPNKDEQIKIGSFFSELDNLITLHQRKLEHLQEQKKALLQQMFI